MSSLYETYTNSTYAILLKIIRKVTERQRHIRQAYGTNCQKKLRVFIYTQLKFTYFLTDPENKFRLNGKGEGCTIANSPLQSISLPIKAYPSRKICCEEK